MWPDSDRAGHCLSHCLTLDICQRFEAFLVLLPCAKVSFSEFCHKRGKTLHNTK